MKDIERLFLDEMDKLRISGRFAAEDNPALQHYFGESSNDPDVERLKEAFSFLMARLRLKIDDNFPEITHPLLESVWPYALRPIPATTIVQFTANRNKKYINESLVIPQKSKVHGKNPGNVITFETVQALHIEPLEIIERTITQSHNQTDITLLFKYHGKAPYWKANSFSLYLSHDEKTASLLRYYIDMSLIETRISIGNTLVATDQINPLTWAPTKEGLILPDGSDVYWPLQLLSQYYHLAHVHDFIVLDFEPPLTDITLSAENTFAISFTFDTVLPFESLENCFLMNCVPVVNLEDKISTAVSFKQDQSEYPLPLQDNTGLYCIRAVHHCYTETEPGKRAEDHHYSPLTGLRNGHNDFTDDRKNHYYYQHTWTDDTFDNPRAGLRFFTPQLTPVTELSSQSFTCHYRSFDLVIDGACHIAAISADIAPGLDVRNITPFTAVLPATHDSRTHWHAVINYLSMGSILLNHKEQLVQMLKDMNFYAHRDIPRATAILKQIDSITAVETRPTDRLVRGVPFRGHQMFLTLDPDKFDHTGDMYLFAKVLNSVLTFCLSETFFLLMNVINARSHEVWTFEPVAGQHPVM